MTGTCDSCEQEALTHTIDLDGKTFNVCSRCHPNPALMEVLRRLDRPAE